MESPWVMRVVDPSLDADDRHREAHAVRSEEVVERAAQADKNRRKPRQLRGLHPIYTAGRCPRPVHANPGPQCTVRYRGVFRTFPSSIAIFANYV